MKNLKVLLADDHNIVRKGLRALLEKETGIEIIYEAENGYEVLEYLSKELPNLIIMDLSMPRLNGIYTTEKIKIKYPSVKVLILSRHEAKEYVLSAIGVGADGYLVKKSAPEELITAIKAIVDGDMYLSPAVSKIILKRLSIKGKYFTKSGELTGRENEIFQLLAEGYETKEIAEMLFISVDTASSHRKNLMKKLNVKNIAELTKLAIKEGIVEMDLLEHNNSH